MCMKHTLNEKQNASIALYEKSCLTVRITCAFNGLMFKDFFQKSYGQNLMMYCCHKKS